MQNQEFLQRQVRLEKIIENIFEELYKAETKFPGFPINVIHAGSIVAEEAGELVKACNEYTYENGPSENVIKEAIHTGAMAIRFLFNFEYMKPIKSEWI